MFKKINSFEYKFIKELFSLRNKLLQLYYNNHEKIINEFHIAEDGLENEFIWK